MRMVRERASGTLTLPLACSFATQRDQGSALSTEETVLPTAGIRSPESSAVRNSHCMRYRSWGFDHYDEALVATDRRGCLDYLAMGKEVPAGFVTSLRLPPSFALAIVREDGPLCHESRGDRRGSPVDADRRIDRRAGIRHKSSLRDGIFPRAQQQHKSIAESAALVLS